MKLSKLKQNHRACHCDLCTFWTPRFKLLKSKLPKEDHKTLKEMWDGLEELVWSLSDLTSGLIHKEKK